MNDETHQAGEGLAAATLGRDYAEIRDAVAAICAKYPGAYWRKLEDTTGYATEFVKELTDAAEEVVLDYVKSGGSASGEQKANVLIIRKDLLDAYKANPLLGAAIELDRGAADARAARFLHHARRSRNRRRPGLSSVAHADADVREEVRRGVVEPPADAEAEFEVVGEHDVAADAPVLEVDRLLLAPRHDAEVLGMHVPALADGHPKRRRRRPLVERVERRARGRRHQGRGGGRQDERHRHRGDRPRGVQRAPVPHLPAGRRPRQLEELLPQRAPRARRRPQGERD